MLICSWKHYWVVYALAITAWILDMVEMRNYYKDVRHESTILLNRTLDRWQ